MEYIYAAMLLHKAGKDINEENITQVMTAAGIKPDIVRVKALVASLAEVKIDEAIKAAPTMMAAPAAAAAPAAEANRKKKRKKRRKTKNRKRKQHSKA